VLKTAVKLDIPVIPVLRRWRQEDCEFKEAWTTYKEILTQKKNVGEVA
jgi:hypothetical protein